MPYYKIRHLTRFRYSAPVYQSVTEIRMQPRQDGDQRLVSFTLSVQPRAHVTSHQDYLGNVIHGYTIPAHHTQATITAQAIVGMPPSSEIPDSMTPQAWDDLDRLVSQNNYWEMMLPSTFATQTPMLNELALELNVTRRDDPLSVLRELNWAIYERFEYKQQVTEVHSPIDEALKMRAGVCQDFAHIFTALVRKLVIPARYVSGYLAPEFSHHQDTSLGATHAWVEALLPDLGWVGFDPTNNALASSGHIRVALGRDYADVPPTRGVYKGDGKSELSVAVQLTPYKEPEADLAEGDPQWVLATGTHVLSDEEQQRQQQQ
jgi:transglutaminase-like putative cysteine protease